jgi:hypothetical protein
MSNMRGTSLSQFFLAKAGIAPNFIARMIDSFPDACFADNFLRVITERYTGWDLEEVGKKRHIASDEDASLYKRRLFESFRIRISVTFSLPLISYQDLLRHVLYLSRRSRTWESLLLSRPAQHLAAMMILKSQFLGMQALRLNPFQATFWLRNTKASATMTNTV